MTIVNITTDKLQKLASLKKDYSTTKELLEKQAKAISDLVDEINEIYKDVGIKVVMGDAAVVVNGGSIVTEQMIIDGVIKENTCVKLLEADNEANRLFRADSLVEGEIYTVGNADPEDMTIYILGIDRWYKIADNKFEVVG